MLNFKQFTEAKIIDFNKHLQRKKLRKSPSTVKKLLTKQEPSDIEKSADAKFAYIDIMFKLHDIEKKQIKIPGKLQPRTRLTIGRSIRSIDGMNSLYLFTSRASMGVDSRDKELVFSHIHRLIGALKDMSDIISTFISQHKIYDLWQLKMDKSFKQILDFKKEIDEKLLSAISFKGKIDREGF